MANPRYTLHFLMLILVIFALWNLSPISPQAKVPIIKSPVLKLSKEYEARHSKELQNDVYSYLMSGKSKPSYCLPIPAKLSSAHKDNLLDCSLPYVYISDGGRLGNQLCQYASVWLLREIFGIRVAIKHLTKRILSSKFQELQFPTYTKECFTPGAKNINYNKLYRELFANVTRMGKLKNGSYAPADILGGQSYYINHSPCPTDILWLYRNKLQKELAYKASIINNAKAKINDTLHHMGTSRENVTLVTVHVRRTDYKGWLKKNYDAALIGEHYFKRAFSFYRDRLEKPIFLVTSDDPKWCREHLLDHDVAVAASSDPAVDHALLTLGDHHIWSVGTFGFTGILLGNGVVVHPVNYSNKFAAQHEVLDCAIGLNTIVPMNAAE